MSKVTSSQGIVRFIKLKKDGKQVHVGMGMLLDERTILTCAHVVNSALGRKSLEVNYPDDIPLLVTFPMINDERVYRAHLVDLSPPGRNGLDCAILQLEEPAPTAIGQTILSVIPPTDLQNNKLSIYGSLAPGHPGSHLNAHLLGDVGAQWSQLDVEGRFGIQQGFSGGAVWNPQQRTAIGMVIARKVGSEGITAYFLSAHHIAKWQGSQIPVEVRKTPLNRQISFSFIAILLFIIVLVHFLATQGSGALSLVPWAKDSKDLAAFFGAHCFAAIMGPYVMWHAYQHARSFSLRNWWQRVPVAFGGRRADMLDNTKLGSVIVIIFLLFVPAFAQGAFLTKVFYKERPVFVNITRLESTKNCKVGYPSHPACDKILHCDPSDKNWCQHKDVGVWSFIHEFPFFDHVYQIAGTCTKDYICKKVTFLPFIQPLILIAVTILAYIWFFCFIYSLIRPWPYSFQSDDGAF